MDPVVPERNQTLTTECTSMKKEGMVLEEQLLEKPEVGLDVSKTYYRFCLNRLQKDEPKSARGRQQGKQWLGGMTPLVGNDPCDQYQSGMDEVHRQVSLIHKGS